MTEMAVWPPKPEVWQISAKFWQTANLRFLTTVSSKKLPLSDYKYDRQPEMVDEIGSTYIFVAVADSVEIATENPTFSTACSMTVSPSDYHNER